MTFVGDKYCPEVSYEDPLALDSISNIAKTGANWIAIVVTEYQDYTNSTQIYPLINTTKHNDYFTFKTETPKGIENVINHAHRLGMKVMLKPHIDLTEEKNKLIWRGNIGEDFKTEEQWLAWFESYNQFIVKYAKMAQALNVDMFSLSCELIVVSRRDDLWRNIIKNVRGVYSGVLTDSANHDGEEFEKTWWDEMDYIGVDAYYLSIKTKDYTTNLTTMEQQLTKVAEKLEKLSKKYKKDVIITEVGFCSGNCERNETATIYQQYMQAEFYDIFMKVFNRYDFIKGYFWWAWNSDPNFGNLEESCISPQHKFSEQVLKKYYVEKEVRNSKQSIISNYIDYNNYLSVPKGTAKCICTI